MHALVPVFKILQKKIRVTEKICEKAGVKVLRELTEKSVTCNALTTSNIKLSVFFREADRTE